MKLRRQIIIIMIGNEKDERNDANGERRAMAKKMENIMVMMN